MYFFLKKQRLERCDGNVEWKLQLKGTWGLRETEFERMNERLKDGNLLMLYTQKSGHVQLSLLAEKQVFMWI